MKVIRLWYLDKSIVYPKQNRTPQKSQHRSKTPQKYRSAEKQRPPPSGQNNISDNLRPEKHRPPPSGQKNISNDFRPKKAHPLDPTMRPSQGLPSRVQYVDNNIQSDDGLESVESFGEFHSPKEHLATRRYEQYYFILTTTNSNPGYFFYKKFVIFLF